MSDKDERQKEKIKRIIQEADHRNSSASDSTKVTDFFSAAKRMGREINPPTNTQTISGNNNTGIIGNNNRIEIHVAAPPKNGQVKIDVTPGPDSITDRQAAEIRELVGKVVSVSDGNFSHVWATLKKKFRFTKYQLIHKHDFDDIRQYLRAWIASRESKNSKQPSPGYRKKLLARLHAEASKQRGLMDSIREYAVTEFDERSLANLTPNQLMVLIKVFKL